MACIKEREIYVRGVGAASNIKLVAREDQKFDIGFTFVKIIRFTQKHKILERTVGALYFKRWEFEIF